MNSASIHKADAPKGANQKRRKVAYHGNMDPECVALCDAMNLIPGIRTYESCCGHGQSPFWIWFDVKSLDHLPNLLYWFDPCHCGFHGWRVIVGTDCAKSPVHFYVEGPVGAFKEANEIARLITKDNE